MSAKSSKYLKILITASVLGAAVILVRTFVLTTYYLGDSGAVSLGTFDAHSLLFVRRGTGRLESKEVWVYRDPWAKSASGGGQLSIGRCVGIPSSTYILGDSLPLRVPAKGEDVQLTPQTLQYVLPLVLMDMGRSFDNSSPELIAHLSTLTSYKVNQDYCLFQTSGDAYVWVRLEDVVGKVVGALRLPF